MALKKYNPVTPGTRQLTLVDRSELYKGKPVKALTEGKTGSGGRNNLGRVTVRFRGGGHKKAYRLVDFNRRGKLGIAAKVERLEYDPNRTAFIALIRYADETLSYILAPQRLAVGDEVVASETADIKPATRFRFRPFRSAPSCTTSRPRSARAASSHVRPAPMRRSSVATRAMSSFA